MAELATIARPYAEALFRTVSDSDAPALKQQMSWLAALAADAGLLQHADDPKVAPIQVFDLVAGVALSQGQALDARVANLLQVMLENGRLAAVPEVAAQFQVLVNARVGVSDALIQSAYPIEGEMLADVVQTLQARFARALNVRVEVVPELIGGIRVVVGDEVLDTSVKARLDQMKLALTA